MVPMPSSPQIKLRLNSLKRLDAVIEIEFGRTKAHVKVGGSNSRT